MKKSSVAGITAFLLTGLLLSLLLYINKSPQKLNAATEPMMQLHSADLDESQFGNNPPTYLLIAIGVVGLIGIRRKVKKECDVYCRAPQNDEDKENTTTEIRIVS